MSGEIVPFRASDERAAEPHNVEAEQALLGALMARNSALERIGFLKPEHFASPLHGRIFAAVMQLVGDGRGADPLTLKSYFERDPALADGAAGYLVTLMASVVTVVNVPDYARTIFDCWRRREIAALAGNMRDAAIAFDMEASTSDLIADAEQRLLDLADAAPDAGGPKPLVEGLDQALAQTQAALRGETAAAIKTGLIDLDNIIAGLRAPRLYILGGRPGMGKSTIAKTMALAAARAGASVLIFSLEMSLAELSQWCLADMTGISAARQESGEVTDTELDALARARGDLALLPLHIDDTATLTLPQMRGRARKFARRAKGPVLVIVDHLGLLLASPDAQRQGATAEVSEISRGLKVLAKEMSVPVLALCQLNRSLESRDDKRPNLSDLRQSGSIEQDADVVLFAYRKEYYLGKAEPERRPSDTDEKHAARLADWRAELDRVKGLAQIIVSKQRGGPEGVATVAWQPERSRVMNLARGIV